MADGKRDTLHHLYAHDVRVTPWAGTAHSVLQAVNTYAHHHGVVRGDHRAERTQLKTLTGEFAQLDRTTLPHTHPDPAESRLTHRKPTRSACRPSERWAGPGASLSFHHQPRGCPCLHGVRNRASDHRMACPVRVCVCVIASGGLAVAAGCAR